MQTVADISFSQRVVAVHDALTASGIPFAFGGALALAYHVPEPRATNDIDVDIHLELTRESIDSLQLALTGIVEFTNEDIELFLRDGQARTYWDDFAVDIFFSVHQFHDDAMSKIKWVPFSGRMIPILSATHLAVLKALFNRSKDWIDLQEMAYVESFPKLRVMTWLRELLDDPSDDRPVRIAALRSQRESEPVAKRLFRPLSVPIDET